MWSLHFTYSGKILRIDMACKNEHGLLHLWLQKLLEDVRSFNLFHKRICDQQMRTQQCTLLFCCSLIMTANTECLVDWHDKRQSIDKIWWNKTCLMQSKSWQPACWPLVFWVTIKMCVNWEPYCSCSWQPFYAFVRRGPKILPPCASRAPAKWSRSITEEEAMTVI